MEIQVSSRKENSNGEKLTFGVNVQPYVETISHRTFMTLMETQIISGIAGTESGF